jgi:SH3-like domain-containing protein
MEIIAEFEEWRKVRDKSGDSGWIHKSMLSQKRYVIILEDNLLLHKDENPESPTVARFQKNAMAQIIKCNALNCQLLVRTPASTIKGWAPRRHLWGLYSHETLVKRIRRVCSYATLGAAAIRWPELRRLPLAVGLDKFRVSKL